MDPFTLAAVGVGIYAIHRLSAAQPPAVERANDEAVVYHPMKNNWGANTDLAPKVVKITQDVDRYGSPVYIATTDTGSNFRTYPPGAMGQGGMPMTDNAEGFSKQ